MLFSLLGNGGHTCTLLVFVDIARVDWIKIPCDKILARGWICKGKNCPLMDNTTCLDCS